MHIILYRTQTIEDIENNKTESKTDIQPVYNFQDLEHNLVGFNVVGVNYISFLDLIILIIDDKDKQ